MKFPVDLLQKCYFLAGPTASGKTLLGIELAKHIDGEILSLDSMAIFRGMDIGTAKPTATERSFVPHHLIDLADPHEDFSTAEYMRQALGTCETIVARGKTPIFVGGTGLYLRAILRGVFEGPPADWEYRRKLESQAARGGAYWLHQQLQSVDPVSASRLHCNDARRLIRALEISHLTGTPASALQNEVPLPEGLRPRNVFWLSPPRDWLYKRINRRVELMMDQGFVREVETLLQRNPPIGRTARQGLGYRELIDWIDGRLSSLSETTELIQTRTRQFAKRQHTWFRNLEECRPFEIQANDTLQTTLDRLRSLLHPPDSFQ